METRANYALIGLFTILVIAAGFGFVWWFAVTDTGQARRDLRVVFSGSISGLSKGSAVLFNGLRVGEVTDIRLLPEDPRRVVARIAVDAETPLRQDTKARLEYQGLTGIAQVSLSGGDPGAPPLVAAPNEPGPTIYAERSDFQDLMESARNIAQRADEVLVKIDRVVGQNEAAITATIRNAERFSKALGDNAPGIDNFLAQVGEAAKSIGPLAQKLETLSDNVNRIVAAIEPGSVANTLNNVEAFTRTLADSREEIDTVLKGAAELTRNLNESSRKLDTALDGVTALLDAVDPERVSATVANAEKFTAALGAKSAETEQIIANALELSKKLNTSADRIDGVLKAAENFLGTAAGEEGKGMFEQVREAAAAIRTLATNLDARTAEITSGIQKFTGPGLQEYRQLAEEGRRTLGEIGRAVRQLERNPQQLLFGGQPSVPEYRERR